MSSDLSAAKLLIAPCLAEGPLAGPGRAVVEAARDSAPHPGPRSRAFPVPYLFGWVEQVFQSDAEPSAPPGRSPDPAGPLARRWQPCRFSPLPRPDETGETPEANVETTTGDHYGQLFGSFRPPPYWGRSPRAFSGRGMKQRNRLPTEALSEKHGRWTLVAAVPALLPSPGGSWGPAGSRVSTSRRPGFTDARARVGASGIGGVEFVLGNVLDLPFEADHLRRRLLHRCAPSLHRLADRCPTSAVGVLKARGLGWPRSRSFLRSRVGCSGT